MVDNKYKIIEGLHRLDDYFKDEDDFIYALENAGYFYADEKNVTDEKVYKVITKDMSRLIDGEYIKLLIKKDILGDCDIIYGEDEDSNEFDTVGIENLFLNIVFNTKSLNDVEYEELKGQVVSYFRDSKLFSYLYKKNKAKIDKLLKNDLFFEPNSNKDFLELSNDAFYCLLSFDEDYIGDIVDNLFW